jgi:ribosomal peptide maturation radical SAM protein 1
MSLDIAQGNSHEVSDLPATALPAEPRRPRMALISMPTLAAHFPSFQLALLRPTLERAGIEVETFSLFLDFGAHIGWALNEELSLVRACLAGEWIFGGEAFGETGTKEAYLEKYGGGLEEICRIAGVPLERLLEVKEREVPAFLAAMIEKIDAASFDLIGFSVVFQQMSASLALARRLKERWPAVPIVFGGATFEEDIAEGIMEGSPFVDYVFRGDADETLPAFVFAIAEGRALDGLPGLLRRDRDGRLIKHPRSPNLENLDRTPVPDFDEYFAALERTGYYRWKEAREPMIPIETGRGCWWGMKAHCTFCGLNRAGMAFRAKSVDNVLDMLQELSRRYGHEYFDAIDNIMAPEYIEKLFGELAAKKSDLQIHYEVRPYLTREQLKGLRRGGLYSVQPGIESLSTHVLTLMKKHTTGIRNLTFLKWCTYYGINNLYNILYGFAGERQEDIDLQMAMFADIPHFQAPYGFAQARADRGSPMFHEPEKHGVRNLRPAGVYQYLFPPERYDLHKVSYYFDHDQDEIPPLAAYQPLRQLVATWQRRWRSARRPTMTYRKSWRTLRIIDRRYHPEMRYSLFDRAAELYEACEDPRTLASLRESFPDEEWLQKTLADLLEHKLIAYLDDRYLSLALPANPHH